MPWRDLASRRTGSYHENHKPMPYPTILTLFTRELKMPKPQNRVVVMFILLSVFVLVASPALAGWQDLLNKQKDSSSTTSTTSTNQSSTSSQPSSSAALGSNMSDDEVGSGITQLIQTAVTNSITQLGAQDGFMGNPEVKIPMPGSLSTAEKALRMVGKGDVADEFIESMNRAAEKAVPETAEVFTETIQNMTLEDVRGILNGGDDSATRFFEKNSHEPLQKRILPIVKDATDSTQVTAKYKSLVGQAESAAPYVNLGESADLDQYVTDKALDGLFTVMAEQEKKIRENPAARATDLLKQMFGN